jgi:hypothetical protein
MKAVELRYLAGIVGEKSISNNVGGVKTFSSTLLHPLQAERHFALVEICHANLRLASNRCGSGTQSDPTISSIATSIMITTSNSPGKGSGMPNHYGGDLLHTMGISGFSRVSVWACGPLNLMKIAPSRMQNRTGSERRD